MMTANRYYSTILLSALCCSLIIFGCERTIDDLDPATFPAKGEVFIDGFPGDLIYSAYGDSKVTAFTIDETESYQGSASMKFEVPNVNDPKGGYAGGVFFTSTGRDLSGFDALTFWARSSQAILLDEIGFGNDLEASLYTAGLFGVPLNSNWQKYVIPIPDPSKLTRERGMLYFAEVAENKAGYTFWIDEVKFEKLGTIAHPKPRILDGQDQIISGEIGEVLTIGGLNVSYNMPTGVDQSMSLAPAYFSFSSTNTSVANVNELGQVSVLDSGTTVITAMLAGLAADGSMTIESIGEAIKPATTAPVPSVHPDSVISLFSDAYTNVTVDTWNTRWQFSTAEDSDLKVNGDNIKRYRNLNFVGIEFSSETIDASDMTHFHIDIWTPDPTELPSSFKIRLNDFGSDGTFDGGDDSSHELSFTRPLLQTEQWVSIDVPLTNFTGLLEREHLAQLVLSGDLPTVFIDNVYFYNSGTVINTGPKEGAPVPARDPMQVISIFSDSYSNVPGTDFNPDWGQATVVSQESINGNNTLVYKGLNYQGIQLGANLDASSMTHLHLDYWTDNSSALNSFLISSGPVESGVPLTVPSSGWSSMDIPLSSFSAVDISDIIQFKFDGNGDIYLDNIYFYNDSGGGGSPTMGAPDPVHAPADVISIFSDAYSDVAGTNLNPGWGQATVVTIEPIDGNNTLIYRGLNYQGIELGSSQDVTGMTTLHLDVWSSNSSALSVFLISPGPVETARIISVPTSGWSSLELPLSEFAPVDLTNVFQFKFEGNGDIFIDNIYFHR